MQLSASVPGLRLRTVVEELVERMIIGVVPGYILVLGWRLMKDVLLQVRQPSCSSQDRMLHALHTRPEGCGHYVLLQAGGRPPRGETTKWSVRDRRLHAHMHTAERFEFKVLGLGFRVQVLEGLIFGFRVEG